LDYYTVHGVTTSNRNEAKKKNGSTANIWFLRSAYSKTDSSFFGVSTSGNYFSSSAKGAIGVSPAFRIG